MWWWAHNAIGYWQVLTAVAALERQILKRERKKPKKEDFSNHLPRRFYLYFNHLQYVKLVNPSLLIPLFYNRNYINYISYIILIYINLLSLIQEKSDIYH